MEKKKGKRNMGAKVFLRQILLAFHMLGLSKIVNNREKEMKASPPKVKKAYERTNQLSFQKQINYYIIRVRTSVDDERKRFNETGKIRILIISAVPGIGEKIVFYRSFQRRPGVAARVIKLVTALEMELSNRPSDSKGRFMNLEEVSPRRRVSRSPLLERKGGDRDVEDFWGADVGDYIYKAL